MALWKRLALLRNELGEGGGDPGGGGFDLDAAVADIGSGLGLEKPSDDGLGDGETVNEEVVEPPKPTPAPSPAPTPAPSPAPTPAPSPSPAPSPTPPRFSKDAAPTTWTPAAAAAWAQLPEPVREEIAKRESEMFRGLEQYKQDAGFGREVNKSLGEFRNVLTQNNINPAAFLGSLVNAHLFLADTRNTKEQKQEFINRLAKDYGVTEADPGTTGYVDPQVKGLQDKIAELESRLNGSDTQKANEHRAALGREIETFASDPANVYFDEVAEDVALLIRAMPKDPTKSMKEVLKEAYDRAVWANPVTRAKETARLSEEAGAKAKEEARKAAEAAEKARQGRARTSGHQGSGTAATGSMDDTMQETLAAIRKKEARG